MGLNPDQQKVVDTREGQICLISGPGTGKTTTLIARYNALVNSGVRKSEILSSTFSREAAKTMTTRGGSGNFKTFHSYGYSVLTAEKGKLPLEPELRHRLMFKLVKMLNCDYKLLDRFISKMRHRNITPEQAMEEVNSGNLPYQYAKAHHLYETERKQAGWIDFDCMICDAVALLEQPEVRARHQWKYVMADECQDTDDIQFRLLQLITQKHGNVMCVGDPGQSIYMFRGAKPENMTNFRQWFPRGEYLYLGMNYRSTQTITDFVREYYPLNIPLKEKIVAARTETGVPISYRMFMSENDEAESAVVRSLADPTNSIILARTNHMLGLVENFCLAHDIKYHLLGKSGFWKQSEIIRAVDKLKSYAFLQTSAAMEKVMPELERHYQAEDATPEDNFALENIRQMREFSKRFPVCKDFILFANRVRHAKPKTTGITLSTIHQAKGTEFKHVTVIGVRADMIPHAKGDDEEEKRIFLVAISRAIDDLTLSFVGTPSSYLRRKLNDDMMQKLREQAGNVERLKTQNVLFS